MTDRLLKIPNALNYQGDAKNWKKFKQQFDIYMKASKLDGNGSENKVNIFLNIGGEEAIEIFENLNLSSEEKKDYDAVIKAFDSYCKSKHNEVYKSFKFFTRVQQSSELFREFYDDLLVMASFCNFGDQKNRLIRDRIVAGIRSHELQEQFLKSPDLTLEEVVKICIDKELEKINNVTFKCEQDSIHDESNIEEESDSNYNDLTALESNAVNLSTLDQIHIPNEILFNEMESQEGFVDDVDLMDLSSDMDDVDYKPVGISYKNQSINLPSRKGVPFSSDESWNNDKEIDKPQKENKRKYNRTKTIGRKLARTMKKRTNTKPLNSKRRITRYSLKTECKSEPNEEYDDFLDIPVEDQDEYSEIATEDSEIFSMLNDRREAIDEHPEEAELANDESFLTDYENQIEDRDEYSQTESDSTEICSLNEKNVDTEESKGNLKITDEESDLAEPEKELQDQDEYPEISQENPEVSSCTEDGKSEKDSKKKTSTIGMMNEMAEAEYLLEKGVRIASKKPKKRQRTVKEKIMQINRDNLPPLILKTISKKMLLLGKMPFSCKKCDATFWTSMQLDKHQLVHVLKKAPPPSKPPSKVFKCEECGKEFRKISDLERHIRVHTGEKPSVCNICNKRFQQPYNLNKHLYTHTQEKNFECVICQKKFGRNDVLNRHVLTHSIVKPFRCSVCSKTFIRNTQLKLHLKKHHGLNENPDNGNDAVAGTSSE